MSLKGVGGWLARGGAMWRRPSSFIRQPTTTAAASANTLLAWRRGPCHRLPTHPLFASYSAAPSKPDPVAPSSPLPDNEDTDTIFALSSGQGRAGVAVIRISGTSASGCLEALINGQRLPESRRAVVRRLYSPQTGELLDQAMVIWLPGPKSFTGEDTVELHVHGSRAVIQGVTEALTGLGEEGSSLPLPSRVRPADRGEFTKRAFDNGRMDLTEVEGLADLIAADTAAQRRQALKQVGGALRQQYEGWREELKVCLAHTEAVIDFGDDEEDVDESAYDAIMPRVRRLSQAMTRHLEDGRRGEIIRSGIRVAIVGPPNAGKSTLLNILAQRPAAIVSPVAGTTRDVVEVQLDLGGFPILVSDTAGLRDSTNDPIEVEGMRRAREAAQAAHLTLLVLDVSDVQGSVQSVRGLGLEGLERPIQDLEGLLGHARGREDWLVLLNKKDLLVTDTAAAGGAQKNGQVFPVSCATGDGISDFLGALEGRVKATFETEQSEEDTPVISRARHRRHVARCLEALDRVLVSRPALPIDLAAEELRLASVELGRITGAVDVEELLDVIFRDFCIGK